MLNPLYHLVARAVVDIHLGLAHIFGSGGWGWALSIVVLTMLVRLALFPLFVRQIKTQRTMQMIQPQMKAIREKYKNDKPKMQDELMKLQKEHGNPLFGCLPMLVQIPLFISLYHVLNGFAPKKVHGSYTPYTPKALDGLSLSTASKVAHAKILGVSMSAAFLSPGSLLHYVGSSLTGTRVLSVVLIVIMAATTFITQRQIFGSNSAQMDKSAQTTQRIMLYLSPAMLFIFGFRMPIGVLLYWLTTNVWSMGQQFVVLRRMPPLAAVIPPPAKRVVQVREKPAAGAAQAEPEETPAAPSVRPPRQPRARVVPATDGPALSDTRPPAPRRGKPVKKRGKNQRKGGRR